MAQPITPTPKLDANTTKNFFDMVERNLKKTDGGYISAILIMACYSPRRTRSKIISS
jgi:hypothetical protein